MSLKLNANDARKADNFATVIRESGKYVGTITRAEKLTSKNNVDGLGLSFKTDDGASANYLDIYTVKPNGEQLMGYNTVQAILCCTRVKAADEGRIEFEKWDSEERKMVQTAANGYPSLMGKRIGLVLQKELATHSITGEDSEKIQIAGVFEASTGLMASEILDGKTKAERLELLVKMVMNNPVRDRRKRQTRQAAPVASTQDFDDDIPF